MREIGHAAAGALVVYEPDTAANKDAAKPVRVTYRRPSAHDRRRIRSAGGSSNGDEAVIERLAAAVRQCVVKVENYEVDGMAIDDGEAFATHARDDLFFPVAAEILRESVLDDALEKKHDAPPPSCSAAMSASAGTATSAVPLVYRTVEDAEEGRPTSSQS